MRFSTQRQLSHRQGAIAVLIILLIVPLIALVAFAIDLGNLALTKSEMQTAADSAAICGATFIETDGNSEAKFRSLDAATEMAAANTAGGVVTTLNSESGIEYGYWDTETRVFESPRSSEPSINAIRVQLYRNSTTGGGPVRHAFARVLGIQSSDLFVESVAFIPQPVPARQSQGIGTRFLIDDEMIDKDVPAIEDLARSMRLDPERMLEARNEKSSDPADWFLNLPVGAELELPTGQVGDEGLLDIAANHGHPELPQYPFSDPERHVDFLMYNETSESDSVSRMRYKLFKDSQLDPVKGVGRFNQPGLYPELVNHDFIHVSPVYKSDVSALDGVKSSKKSKGPDLNEDGKADGLTTNEKVKNGVNAKGYRRGLIAFKIIGYRIDPKNTYPYLPNLVIKIMDPTKIDLSAVKPVENWTNSSTVFTSGGVHNVRLAL